MPRPTPIVLALLATTACARHHYLVSNERSDYTPTVRLKAHVTTHHDTAFIRIDSGTALAPGLPNGRPQALMRALTIEPVIAERAPKGTTTIDADGRTVPAYWRPLLVGEPQPLVDSLVMAVPVPTAPHAWTLRLPARATARGTWLAFRIRGNAIATGAVRADGIPMLEGEMRDAIRVYACAERSLAGTRDRRRARRLRKNYLETC